MSTLHIPRSILDQIRAHAEQAYPNECCGALLGRSTHEVWKIEAAIPAANARTDSAHNRYAIAPQGLIKFEREARRLGLDVAGFYHSHPDHTAQWSATDFAEAHWLGCCYVITAIAEGKATVTNSFVLAGSIEEDKRFEQQTILVEDL